MENKGKRLAEAIEYLKQNGEVNNLDDVAQKVDRSKNNISSAINGDKRYLSDKFLKHFNACFKNIFSPNWLLNGVEPMLCGYKNSDPNAPFLLGESEPGTSRTDQEKDDRIRFLEQQLKLEKDKNDLLQQQLNLYEGRV